MGSIELTALKTRETSKITNGSDIPVEIRAANVDNYLNQDRPSKPQRHPAIRTWPEGRNGRHGARTTPDKTQKTTRDDI